MGLTLAFSQILILPLDISNSRGVSPKDQVIPVDLIIIIAYFIIGILTFIVIPLCVFYYEAEEDNAGLVIFSLLQ